jgi:hypothetical protein
VSETLHQTDEDSLEGFEVINIPTDPEGGYERLGVLYRDRRGDPWLCVTEKGEYVYPNGESPNLAALSELAMLGAIGD